MGIILFGRQRLKVQYLSNTNPAFRELKFECREAEIEINQPSVTTYEEHSENNLDTARAYSATGALPSGRKAWEFRARLSIRAGSGGQGRGPNAAAGGRAGVVWARAY